mmetsp:Transcript_7619/g.14825  ORF Transcript_7619/g.14825 Transcript_7619/m.14825 type:complete len:154 (-) Transcript_7619:67-528(-)
MTFRFFWIKLALALSAISLQQGGVQAFVVPRSSSSPRPMTLASAPTQKVNGAAATDNESIKDGKDPSVMISRMAELDMLLEQADEAIEEIDANMALATDDDYLCIDLQKKKERMEKIMNKYYNELDELEAKVESMGYSFEDGEEDGYSDETSM